MERIESKQFRDYSQQIDDITFFQGDTITIPFQFIDFDGDVVTLRKPLRAKPMLNGFYAHLVNIKIH